MPKRFSQTWNKYKDKANKKCDMANDQNTNKTKPKIKQDEAKFI